MSTTPDLNDFQRKAERIVLEALRARGRSLDVREIRVGDVPFFSDQRQILLKLSSGALTILLHDDEVGYTSAVSSGGLERADFQSEQELLGALQELLQTIL